MVAATTKSPGARERCRGQKTKETTAPMSDTHHARNEQSPHLSILDWVAEEGERAEEAVCSLLRTIEEEHGIPFEETLALL